MDVKSALDDIMKQYVNLKVFFKVHLIELVMAQLACMLMQNHVTINPNDSVITWPNGAKSFPPVNTMQIDSQQLKQPAKGRG